MIDNDPCQVWPPAPPRHLHRRWGLRCLLLLPGPLLPPPLPPNLVPQVAHTGLAVLRGRGHDPVPLALHGHSLAEGGGAWVEGQASHEGEDGEKKGDFQFKFASGGREKPLQIRSQWVDSGEGQFFVIILILLRVMLYLIDVMVI